MKQLWEMTFQEVLAHQKEQARLHPLKASDHDFVGPPLTAEQEAWAKRPRQDVEAEFHAAFVEEWKVACTAADRNREASS